MTTEFVIPDWAPKPAEPQLHICGYPSTSQNLGGGLMLCYGCLNLWRFGNDGDKVVGYIEDSPVIRRYYRHLLP